MISYLSDLVQRLLAKTHSLDEIRPWLEELGFGLLGGILGATFLSLMLHLAARFRRDRAVREDGWFYLAPGFAAWSVLLSTSFISLGTLAGALLAIRSGYYKPSLDADGIAALGLFAFIILGFGVIAIASDIAYFRHKVRWNHASIEKITLRGTTRIAWRDVTEIRQEKGADSLRIVSDRARIKVWTHMNGVRQLIAAVDGQEEALGLLRQVRPLIEAKARPDHAGSFRPEGG